MVYYCISLDESQACVFSYGQTCNTKAKGIPVVVTDQTWFILKISLPRDKLLQNSADGEIWYLYQHLIDLILHVATLNTTKCELYCFLYTWTFKFQWEVCDLIPFQFAWCNIGFPVAYKTFTTADLWKHFISSSSLACFQFSCGTSNGISSPQSQKPILELFSLRGLFLLP